MRPMSSGPTDSGGCSAQGRRRSPAPLLPVVALAATLTMPYALSPAAAQPARLAAGNVQGVVLDSLDHPLVGARLQLHQLPRPPRLALTHEAGRFSIDSVPAGDYLLSVRALGFRPAEFVVTVRAGAAPRYEIVLTPLPFELAPVEVEASFGRAGMRMQGFYNRMQRGGGRYFTSEEIERRRPNLLSDMLQTVAGLSFRPAAANSNLRAAYANHGGLNGGRCAMNLYVDGSLLPPGWAVDDLADLPEIAGIEIYDGWMHTPPQFVPADYDRRCGAIAIWTKRSRAWS